MIRQRSASNGIYSLQFNAGRVADRLAEQSVKVHDPERWAVLLDVNGNLADGMGSDMFVVRNGKLYTPSERYVIAGIRRQMTLDLAGKLAIPVIEGDIDLFDAANADEMFLTSTSLCIGSVRNFKWRKRGRWLRGGPLIGEQADVIRKAQES